MNQNISKSARDLLQTIGDGADHYWETEVLPNLSIEQFEEFKRNLESNGDYEKRKDSFIIDEQSRTIIYKLYAIPKNEVSDLTQEEISLYPLCSKQEIKRIFHPKNAQDYLLKLRAEQIRDDMRLFRVFTSIRLAQKEKWSFTGYFKSEYFDDYLKLLPLKIQKICKKTQAGTIHLREANGYCMNTEFGNIILISYSLRFFLYFMNLFKYGGKLGISDIDQFNSFLIAVRTMLGTETLDFEIDSRGKIPERIVKEIESHTNWQMLFIAGHEYAHHYLNHLKKSRLEKLSFISLRVKDAKFYSYSEQNELDADYNAIVKPLSNKVSQAKLANAAFDFFLYLDLYECAEHYLFPPSKGSRSHPIPTNRTLELRQRLTSTIGRNLVTLTDQIETNKRFKQHLINDYLPFNVEQVEMYGSIYLPSYRGKAKLDRLHF